MRRYGMFLAGALALCLVASIALVQEREGRSTNRAARGTAGGRTSRFGGYMFGGGGRGGVYLPDYTRRLTDVSAEQRKQINEIRQATSDKIAELQKRMDAEIKKVLTPEQVKAMEQAQRRVTHRGPDGVTMTDAQKKIVDEARAEAAKVDDREARSAIMQEAMEKVRAGFTEEQKKQAEEMRERMNRFRTRGRGGESARPAPGGNR